MFNKNVPINYCPTNYNILTMATIQKSIEKNVSRTMRPIEIKNKKKNIWKKSHELPRKPHAAVFMIIICFLCYEFIFFLSLLLIFNWFVGQTPSFSIYQPAKRFTIWLMWLWIRRLEINSYVEMNRNFIACKGNNMYLYGIAFE